MALMSDKIIPQISVKDVSSSYCSEPTRSLEPNEIRLSRRRRQNYFAKRKVPKKYRYPIEFWHYAMKHPEAKLNEKIIIESFFIEDRPWKEVQEIFIKKTGVFNTTAALQMKINRLVKKIKSESTSTSSITTISIPDNSLLNESQNTPEVCFREQISEECQTQFNILKNRINLNSDQENQTLSQENFPLWPCGFHESCEQFFAWNRHHISQVEWNNSDEMFSKLLRMPLNDCSNFSVSDIPFWLQRGDNLGTESYHKLQDVKHPKENEGYIGAIYPVDHISGPSYR